MSENEQNNQKSVEPPAVKVDRLRVGETVRISSGSDNEVEKELFEFFDGKVEEFIEAKERGVEFCYSDIYFRKGKRYFRVRRRGWTLTVMRAV